MKERTWLGILLSFAAPCRGKMAASVVLAILSVAGGFVPYLGVYQIIRLFLERQASWEGILFWCGVCLAGYAIKVAGYALSTMLAHVSAYTILEGLRLQAADRLMGAPLGEVDSRPIGAMKSTIVDRIEDIEPPLAHMIPELSSNILLPLVVAIAMFAIDWRMGLALLVTIPVALIPMAFGLRTYNKNYAAYMAANAHVNSVIVEYVEGIQVVKAFSQGERSYQKFANAVRSFRDFTMDWFRCTWASMNLCLSILPTTLLGTLPMGIYLYQTGVLDPAQVTLCLMLALGIVTPLMSATAFTDPENEDKIQRSIMALSKGKTLLVIAHRLATIQNADQIVVLEKGQIVDRGTQRELLDRCPLYQTLWAAHVGARSWAVTSGEKEGT